MSTPTALPATVPFDADHGSAEQLGLDAADAAFEVRWAAWQARGRTHERAVRRRFLMAVPVVVVAAAIVYLFLIP